MTNGEKIKEVFPNLECEVKYHTVLTNIDNGAWFSLEWWNAEYKEPSNSEKTEQVGNPDRFDDCISRQGTIDAIRRIHPIDTDYDCTLFDKVDVMYVLNDMPSATPIRPKGRWIDHSDEGYVECPRCGNATSCDDNINDLHFCFSCGADMRGEEE